MRQTDFKMSLAEFVEKVLAIRAPTFVSRYVLQDGGATRVATLKQMAEEMTLTLNAARQAAQ